MQWRWYVLWLLIRPPLSLPVQPSGQVFIRHGSNRIRRQFFSLSVSLEDKDYHAHAIQCTYNFARERETQMGLRYLFATWSCVHLNAQIATLPARTHLVCASSIVALPSSCLSSRRTYARLPLKIMCFSIWLHLHAACGASRWAALIFLQFILKLNAAPPKEVNITD